MNDDPGDVLNVFKTIRFPMLTTLTMFLLFAGLTSPARADTEVFNSTNLPTSTGTMNSAGSGSWFAYRFDAFDDSAVGEIDVYLDSGVGYQNFFVEIASGFNTGSVGTFQPIATQSGVTCATRTCEKVTFQGEATLQGGQSYWVWIGSSSVNGASTHLFGGQPNTATGLALGYTFSTSDISDRFGSIIMDSNSSGYPWLRMFTRSPTTSVDNAAPTPLIQQFGKPAFGTCDGAAPEDLNWSGVPSGGWGESWAQWVNSGSGGAVCTRMLVYSNSESTWGFD